MSTIHSGTSVEQLQKSLAKIKADLRLAWLQLPKYRKRAQKKIGCRKKGSYPVMIIDSGITRLRKIHRQLLTNGYHEEIDTNSLYKCICYHERKRARLIHPGCGPHPGSLQKHSTFNQRHSETTPPLPHYYSM